jgi:hypothetical protein
VKVLSTIVNFDYLVFDALSSKYSVQDLDKLVENSNISKIIIKRWNKKFIDHNFDSLKNISNKTSILFDYRGYSPREMLLVKEFFEKKSDSIIMDSTFGECSYAPWTKKTINNNYEWVYMGDDISMVSNFKKYNSMIEKNNKYIIAFSNNKDGIYGSDIESLRKMPIQEMSFLSKMNEAIISKNQKSMIYLMSFSNFDEISKIEKNDINKILSMGFSSLAIIDVSSVSKSILSWREYIEVIELTKYLDLFIFGLPFDFYYKESPDLPRFKWIVDNEEFKKNIFNIKSKNKNRVFIVT